MASGGVAVAVVVVIVDDYVGSPSELVDGLGHIVG